MQTVLHCPQEGDADSEDTWLERVGVFYLPVSEKGGLAQEIAVHECLTMAALTVSTGQDHCYPTPREAMPCFDDPRDLLPLSKQCCGLEMGGGCHGAAIRVHDVRSIKQSRQGDAPHCAVGTARGGWGWWCVCV